MWEKKSDDDSIHNKDTLYTRDEAFGFIAALNTANFAGYNDWRLPNVKELLSIVNFETSLTPLDLTTFPPMVSAAFDNNCTSNASVLTGSCTGLSGTYWSSTTYAPVPVSHVGGQLRVWLLDQLRRRPRPCRAGAVQRPYRSPIARIPLVRQASIASPWTVRLLRAPPL